jgi:small-conductance mechanosensitive channel
VAEIWNEPWFWPAVGVVIGLPIVLLVLTEINSVLERRGSRATRIVTVLRNYVAPVGALLVLLSQVRFVHEQPAWWQVTATVFGFLVILVVLNSLNFAIFVTARQGSWRSRVPSIFVDIVRVVIIVILVALLFSTVWQTDIAGLFTALGIGSIVIGLALQNAVGGVVSGLLMLFEQPFQLGDWLVVNGQRARVVEVNWRSVHLKVPTGILVMPNAALAGSAFVNLSKNDVPYEAATIVKFATDDPPSVVIEVCRRVAEDLQWAIPGEEATVTPMAKAQYEVEIPIASPGDTSRTIRTFRTRLWYAARRHDLHLDKDLTDNFQTPENVSFALQRFAPDLYLAAEDMLALETQVKLERYGEGEVIQRPQEVPDGHRYIISGSCQMAAPVEEGAEMPFATFEPGDVMGLTALTRQGLAARVTALTDVAVLFVPVVVLDELVKTRPRLARDIGQELDNRRTWAKAALDSVGVEAPRFLS